MSDRNGIDLGTTNSVMAMYKGGLKFHRNKQGDYLTPSWATWQKDSESWIVGEPARAISVLAPECSVYSAKRLMGRNFSDPNVQEAIKSLPYKVKEAAAGGKGLLIEIDGKDYEPQDIGALVLGKMKDDYEYLNPNMKMEEAVITVPAYFNQSQHIATMEAGARAGLTVLALLPEPSAAALAFGTDPEKHDGRMILVYDLGGGTFDVTVILVSEGDFVTTGLSGDMWLGGNDFDRCIANFIVEHIKKTHKKDPTERPSSIMEITKWAERTKMRLSDMEEVEIQEVLGDMGNLLVKMKIEKSPKCSQCGERCVVSAKDTGNRDKDGYPIYQAVALCPHCDVEIQGQVVEKTFDGAIMPLVQRTMDLMDKAFANAGITDDDIDEVLMVGGSTFVPLVREKVRERFGPEKVRFDLDPMRCVAQGAAVYATKIPAKVKCLKCGTWNDLGVKECKKCHFVFPTHVMEEAKKQFTECTNCGYPELPPNWTECPKCGLKSGDKETGGFTGTLAQSYGIGLAGGKLHIIIPAGTNYPMMEGHTEVFQTESDKQRIVDIPVYCGENVDDAAQNDLMGDVIVMLEKPVPKNTDVDVTFAFDRNMTLEVTVEVKGEGKGTRASGQFESAGRSGANAKGVFDRASEIRKRAGARLTPEQQARLQKLETRAVDLAGNETLSSSHKRDEMDAVDEELQKIAAEAGVEEEKPKWMHEAEGSIAWANLIIHKIGELLDPDIAHELPKLAQSLQRCIDLKDQEKGETLTSRIDEIVQSLDKIPQMAFQAYVATFRIQQWNPAEAEKFRSRLDRLIPDLATGSYEAEEEFERLFAEIMTAVRSGIGGGGGGQGEGPGTGVRFNPFLSK
ncbi:MAG TPA: Hsp70 family protein [Candidatus Hydrogenedentes bacterium]|nr:Hsp70 family protein [Candidatus Hydrogenedentota bacterium]